MVGDESRTEYEAERSYMKVYKDAESHSDTEEMLAGELVEGTSQTLLQVSLPLCRGDDLPLCRGDQRLAVKAVWTGVKTCLPSPLKSRGSHKATIWSCSRVCQHLLFFEGQIQ